MDTRTGTDTAGKWVSVDEWLKTTDETRAEAPMRSLARPVNPASDRECFALNPPHGYTFRDAGLPQPRRTARERHIEAAEQRAREESTRRVNTTSDAILRLTQDNA